MDETSSSGDWYCHTCGYLAGSRVTYDETCDTCHQPVVVHTAEERSDVERLTAELTEARAAVHTAAGAGIELDRRAQERIAALHAELAAAREALGACVDAIRRWAREEDGVPDLAAPAFMRAIGVLGWSVSCDADLSALSATVLAEGGVTLEARPEPTVCGARDHFSPRKCDRPAGHDGLHDDSRIPTSEASHG